MKLTRQQELALIQIGLNSVLNGLISKPKNPRSKSRKTKKRQWSDAQRKKFAKTMAQVWKDKKANNG
jgi:hypothetical protein